MTHNLQIKIILKKDVIVDTDEEIRKLGYTRFKHPDYQEVTIASYLIESFSNNCITLPDTCFPFLQIGHSSTDGWLFLYTYRKNYETLNAFLPLSYIDMIIDGDTGEVFW